MRQSEISQTKKSIHCVIPTYKIRENAVISVVTGSMLVVAKGLGGEGKPQRSEKGQRRSYKRTRENF